ncbi:putative bifunctional diguanylate cyclase/phosphodiesterase [Janthinobacterium sp. Mn2066]|uniref:putative bifunctional diguanylate cyclase/phosphodiesterase n=1 Tax=Janthinobacterium sp. Mn2066 TaxID=3395264 RepID=UPI003BD08FFC
MLRATVDRPLRPPRLAMVLAWLGAVWRGSRAWSVLCAILTICLLLCIWIYTAIRLDDEVQQALDRARIENHDVATILGAHLDDALGAAPELPPDLSFFLRPYRDISSKARDRIEIINHQGVLLAAMENGVPTMAPKSHAPHAMPPLLEQRLVARHGLLVRVSQDQALVLAALAGVRRRHLTQAGLLSLALLSLGGAILLAARRRLQWQRRQAEGEQITLSLQLAQEKSRADQLAAHDALTGVASRRRFYESAGGKLLHARRSRNHYALLYLDIDRFKQVNERLGYLAGDALLQAAAQRLQQVLREYDVLARLGGDEFVVLLSEVASEERVAAIASAVLAALRQPFTAIAGHEIAATASIGIALYPRDGQSVDALLSSADSALSAAKAGGRDGFRFHDMALNLSSARSLELQGRFGTAMRDNEFCFHYQGKFDTAQLRIVGLEALLRWDHPQHGLIFPNEFIGLAEETDAIVALGNWSIDVVCRQLAQWRQAGLPLSPVAINISAKQLRDPLLPETVMRALARHAIAPGLLELEVTESCFIDDISQAKNVLRRLRALGLTISLDDYGTGYSGLSHIKMLPIHTLKIDRSFIRDIAIDRNDAMIVASTIALARGLGLQVVAEGVESDEQLAHLRRLGCQQVQGFYLHRPAPAAAVAALLAEGRPALADAM